MSVSLNFRENRKIGGGGQAFFPKFTPSLSAAAIAKIVFRKVSPEGHLANIFGLHFTVYDWCPRTPAVLIPTKLA
jgi:hypothetical protein